MTKYEALKAMKDGHKVTHRFFMASEYIFFKNGCIYSEDGVNHGSSFFLLRSTEDWLNDWSIFEEVITPEQQFNSVVKWQNETFKKSTAISKVHHLLEEVVELNIELTTYSETEGDVKQHVDKAIRSEFADCFILLYGAAHAHGMSFQDIIKCIEDKMTINRNRKWGKPDSNGVVNHVK